MNTSLHRTTGSIIAVSALVASFVILAVPFVTSAATTATAVTDQTALYTLDFDFIAGSEAYRVPVATAFGASFASGRDVVGYDLRSEGETVTDLERTAGVIVSEQPIENGHYVIPANDRASFQLLVIANRGDAPLPLDLTLHLTSLPHYNGTVRTNPAPNRLDRFVTPAAEFRDTVSSATHRLQLK